MPAGTCSFGPMASAMVLCAAMVLPRTAVATSITSIAAPSPPSAGVSAQSSKKVHMVTEILQDILQSVGNEEKKEAELHDRYMSWCQSETTGLTKDLKESGEELANAKVVAQEQASCIDGLNLFISKNVKEVEETKDSIAQAAALRKAESEKTTEDMQINAQSVRQIDLAIKHVGTVQKHGGFLQNGETEKLQVNQPGESSYVLGVMKGLKEKLEKSRKSMRKTEEEKVQMHNSFMETKGQSLKRLNAKTVEKKIANTETVAQASSTQQKIAKLTEEIATLAAAVDKTGDTCESTKREWHLRQEDRSKEKAALNEATRYLTEMSLEQLSLAQPVQRSEEEHRDASVVFAPEFLQEIVAENTFFKAANALLTGDDAEVQAHLRKHDFNGVKTVVRKLIASHQNTQKEEKEKKAYCKKEIAGKDSEKTTTGDNLASVSANIDKKASQVEMLINEVNKLSASIDQVKRSLTEAGKLRKQETVVFTAGSKDRMLAIKVLNQAKSVLQEFYKKAQGSLLQTPPAKVSSARKNIASFGAVSMIQEIVEDISKEQADAVSQEKEASDTYATLQTESQEATDSKQQDITDRVTAKAKLGVQINTLKETESQQKNDLESISNQLTALHESCDELLQFYDKREKARSFEVSQLRDVKDILAGSDIAPRTGLVQDESTKLQQGETA